MDEMKEFWNEHQKGCPLKDSGDNCKAQYDSIYHSLECCDEYSCPMLYWLEQYQIHTIKQPNESRLRGFLTGRR